MPPFTKDSTVVSQKLKDILEANATTLGLQNVSYGDTRLIPLFPAVTVESGTKRRTLEEDASSHKWAIFFTTFLTVWHEKIQDVEITRKENEQLVEAIEDVLHTNMTLDGLILFGFVTRNDPGIIIRPEKIMMRATRMTWEGRSRERF